MRAAPARGDRRVPGRARLERYVDHAGLAAGRSQPGRPAAPLPDEERPRPRRGRAPRRAARRRAAAAAAAADGSGAPARLEMLGEHFTARVLRRPRAVGRRPHRRRRSRPRWPRWSSASGRETHRQHRRPARRRRVAARHAASWCRPPSTWSAASAWPTLSPTTPPRGRILDEWAALLDVCSPSREDPRGAPGPARVDARRLRPTSPGRRPAGERARGAGAAARRPGLAHARRRPTAATSPPRWRTWPGPTRSPSRRGRCRPGRGMGRRHRGRRSTTPTGFVDAGPAAAPTDRGELLGGWRPPA